MGYPLGMSSAAVATFTPAAASHVADDVVGGAQEFLHVGPNGARMVIQSVSLLISNATIETTAWQLHLYTVTPPSAIADDAAFDLPSGDRDAYLGFLDIVQVVDYGASLYIEANDIQKQVRLRTSSLFGYLVNDTTLTPGAVAHKVTLNCYAR